MQTFELGVLHILSKFREAEEYEGVGGGITRVKVHKGPSKLEEVANDGDYAIQATSPSLNETFTLHHCLL